MSCAFDGKIRVWDWGDTREAHDNDDSSGAERKGEADNDLSAAGRLLDEETKRKIVHEFSHESQFRCLAYYARTKEILAGTEESRILSFSLEAKRNKKGKEADVDVQDLNVEREGQGDEEQEYDVVDGNDESGRAKILCVSNGCAWRYDRM